MVAPDQQIPVSDQSISQQHEKALFCRFMLPDTSEHTCRVASMDLDTAILATEIDVPGGVKIVIYVEDIGRLEAMILGRIETGLRVVFELTDSRRERLKKRLGAILSGDQGSLEDRRHERFRPQDSYSHITLPDGRLYDCEVLDISLSGAAIKLDVMPALGTQVRLGKMLARVVRHHSSGVGLEFLQQLDPATFASKAS